MSDFKAKMHQIRIPMELRPRLRWRSTCSAAPPDLLVVFKGPTSKGKQGKEGKGRGGEGEGRGEEERGVLPPNWGDWIRQCVAKRLKYVCIIHDHLLQISC